VKKINEKLEFWEHEAQAMTEIISQEDSVWISWRNLMSTFKGHMRWIEKLASDSFKDPQFDELFTSIALKFDPKKEYTVQELIDLRLDDYADLIGLIYRASNSENFQSQKLSLITEMWTNRIQFKLAKNFPAKLYKSSNFDLQTVATAVMTSTANVTRSVKLRELKDLAEQQTSEQAYLMKNASYKLVDIDEIRYFAEDSTIKLSIIANSKITKKTREECLDFKMKISEILKLTELWFELQHKVKL
jgi:hypothetical protein